VFEQRVTLLTLGVADVGRARAFYEALGWRASSVSQEGVAFFRLGGIGLALYPQGELSRDTGLDAPAPGGVTLAYNTRSRGEVETLVAEAVAAGGKLLKGANETEWGGYVAYFADPDGHPWEITHAPMFVPAADGTIEIPE
jgi:uncharacterized protein